MSSPAEETCEEDFHSYLTVVDYVVFAMVLGFSALIGIVYWLKDRNKESAENFLMADRQMSVLPVTLSLLASFMSAITLLGTPAEVYQFGTQYWMIWPGYVFMIILATQIFVPVFYKLHITSVFEYLEHRFCRGLRTAGAVLYICQMVLYMGMVLYTPTLALSAVTGLNVWMSVVTIGVVCTFYTTIGGMKAVMWTDAFQILMMFIGLVAIMVRGSVDHGGFGNILKYLYEGQRVEFFNLDPTPTTRHTFWAMTIGGTFTWLAIYGVNQAQVQRAMCTPTMRQGQMAMWLNLPGLMGLLTICCLCGAVCYAEYRDCDPLVSGRITAMDQMLPRYVMDRLLTFPGIPGLFVASLFSAALSTVSSGLNSLAAVTLQDLVKAYWWPTINDQQGATVSKVLAIIFGCLMILMAYISSHMGALLQAALGLFGMIGGPVLGLYSLGLIYPWANKKGATAGLVCALTWTLWIGVGAQIYKPTVWRPPVSVAGCPVSNCTTSNVTMATGTFLPVTSPSSIIADATIPPPVDATQMAGYLSIYELSYMWYALSAVVIVHTVGLSVSFATGANSPQDVNPELICPLFDVLCCCLPRRWGQRTYFGVRHHEKPRIELNGIKEIPEYNFSETSHVKMEQLNGTHNAAFDTTVS